MKTAVIVENFGGPRRADEVEPFLFNLFNDPDVIQLPFGPAFQRFLARRISRSRAPKVLPDYERIGFSPLVDTTFAQARALEAVLAERLPEGRRPTLHVGMRYTAPFVADAVDEALDAGAERIVALPLFPQYSFTTTGSVHNAVARALEARGRADLPLSYVPAFYAHPRYLAAVVARIREGLAEAPPGVTPYLLFSAHGLPSKYVRRGDPYMQQVQESVRRIIAALGWEGPWSLAWQSRVGPVKWLDPSTDRVLERLGEERTPAILVVPISFVGDHVETLYEIGHTYRELALARGVGWFGVMRGLDDHPEFIACLAEVTAAALAGAFDRLCFRCLLPREHAHLAAAACVDCKTKRPHYERLWRASQGPPAAKALPPPR